MSTENNDDVLKIVSIDVLRTNRNHKKNCVCEDFEFEVDTDNHEIVCTVCGAIVDPFEALNRIAQSWERVNAQIQHAHDKATELENYKPWLRAVKTLESNYRSKMIPYCPHCKKPVDIVELSKTGCHRIDGT